jgi:hypothetical protein
MTKVFKLSGHANATDFLAAEVEVTQLQAEVVEEAVEEAALVSWCRVFPASRLNFSKSTAMPAVIGLEQPHLPNVGT